ERGERPLHGNLSALGGRRPRVQLPIPRGLPARRGLRHESFRPRARPPAAAGSHRPATGAGEPAPDAGMLANLVRSDSAGFCLLVFIGTTAAPLPARWLRAIGGRRAGP